MSSSNVLEIVNAGLAVLKLLSSVNVDINELISLQKKAESENREINFEEIRNLSNRAQKSINEL